MDFHPPQGAHTSYLRTLSKIVRLRNLPFRVPGHFVVGSRTFYIAFGFRQHLEATFFSFAPTGFPVDSPHLAGLLDRPGEGPRILHPIPVSSTPPRHFFFVAGGLSPGFPSPRPDCEGPRILHPFPRSSSSSEEVFCTTRKGRRRSRPVNGNPATRNRGRAAARCSRTGAWRSGDARLHSLRGRRRRPSPPRRAARPSAARPDRARRRR